MARKFRPGFVCLIFIFSLFTIARAQDAARVVFMEPEEATAPGKASVYRIVTDSKRLDDYTRWMNNYSARLALDLYTRAWRTAESLDRQTPRQPVYYVALVKGGNHADIGFELRTASNIEPHPRTSYIKLDPQEWTFSNTFLHETGHVILSLLNKGDGIPKKDIASIPHTTSALTDRGTAFNEGFAIHLETLAAHTSSEPALVERYHHRRFSFGSPRIQGEYHRHAADLLSFAQTLARYTEVRENSYAFSPAFKGPDYLRVQLDKARDFSALRDANQLLQSEGFYATFFFGHLLRGEAPASNEVIKERQDRMLMVLARMFRSGAMDADSPFLLRFVETFMQVYPAESSEVVDVLMDLSRGVFVDAAARRMWRDHYLGALRLDMAERNNEQLEAARKRWKASVMKDARLLYSLVGPQVYCEVPARSVLLVAFGQSAPLSFDVNTVEEGVIRLIPAITGAEVESWISARGERPFADAEDFKKRASLSAQTVSSMKF
jgi:hypothetical protein